MEFRSFEKTVIMSTNYLKLNYFEENHYELDFDEFQCRNKPFANSDVFCAQIQNFEKLTKGEDVNRVYDLEISLKDISYEFLPGDTIAILPYNNEREIDKLILRLNLIETCNKICYLEIMSDTTKKNPTIPKHLPVQSTLKDIFLRYIDIRTVPKKLFLKALLKYTKDMEEAKFLELICSLKGSKEYNEFVNKNRTLLDVLTTFSSCHPPVEIILEHSTPLQPRLFSISTSPFMKETFNIIFSVAEFENGTKGVCTGWLEDLLQEKETVVKIPFYFCKANSFRLLNLSTPKILIATGTGIAPFRGFLQHLDILKKSENISETWLIYGCRYSDRDFLCKTQINEFYKNKTLSEVIVAFSREQNKKCYVQDKILENSEKFVEFIVKQEAAIYLCGNTKTVLKDVREAIRTCFVNYLNIKECEAEDMLINLEKNDRYIVDTWT